MSRKLIALTAFGSLLVWPAPAANPVRVAWEMEEGIPPRATAGGKYTGLLKVLKVPEDKNSYGEFSDWGFWNGTLYAGYKDLPAGHWVYLAPKWYIWGKKVK